jgi:hypothetical protein
MNTLLELYKPGLLPFIDYIYEDKSIYPLATTKNYIDEDDDFRIGNSGGILMNIDFCFVDTHKFSEVAKEYEKNGVYTKFHPGTKGFKDFWDRETKRRRSGYVANCKLLHRDIPVYRACKTDTERARYVHSVRITGDHYHFLNYSRINRTPTKQEREDLDNKGMYKIKLVQKFPRFWDGHYWNFKIDEFTVRNGFHLCKGKARGKGYSYQRAAQGANTMNLNPNIIMVMGAYLLDYLVDPDATTDMLKRNLDWLEDKTYWRRGYLSQDYKELELGYKKAKHGSKKYGWRSKCISVSFFNNASAAIGKRAIEIDIEEAGKCPNLQDVLNVTLSSTEVGGENIGIVRIYGTAGAKNADWRAFSRAFYNPRSNKMLPLENVFDRGKRNTTCGFFHPQVWNYEPYMDKDGNSLFISAYFADAEDKAKVAEDLNLSDYIIYTSQRANSPEEAFNTGVENLFSSPELSEHIRNIQNNPEMRSYRDGMLVKDDRGDIKFRTNSELKVLGTKVHPYIEDVPFDHNKDLHGCLREFHPPFRDSNGAIIPNVHYITFDPVGVDKDKEKITAKHSLNAFHVLTYPNNPLGIPGDMICMSYAGRQEKMEDCSRLLSLVAQFYNAKIIAEVDRGQIVQDYRRWQMLNLLYKDPTSILDAKSKINLNPAYGLVIGSTQKAEDGLLYLKDWLYTPLSVRADGSKVYVLHYIKDLPTLLEFANYSKNGNFDRVSSLRVGMFQRLAYLIKFRKEQKHKDRSKVGTLLSEIGLYGIN